MTLACRAGRVNVLEWIVKNEAKLPAPVFATSTFDFAFSHGHVKVLQWLADHGFVERMREMDKTRDLGGRASFEYRTISFVPEKWPECFECLEWSWANGFKMSKSMRKRVKAKVRYSSVGTLYLYLIQRKRPWGA
ncbi:hypothetical protein BCR44DRAFT_36541 [Catenaria anguillulae PL171]|uniref:Ankyrin repeat-containing domain protein n=1 Tax=Catenaria anguillulae PL171 TaxID=765915 RepID=A0A1Y2I574_9FUNG|nr:hypothetical protein BCR44DRAFT_36541 [Catenaria anguillulae PL171]